MPVNFLNEAERDRLNRFPEQISDKDLVLFFALSASDKAQSRKQRGDHNQLGYSIQLCALRYLGFAPDDLKSIPWEALSYIALQIDVDPEALHSYGNRIHTRTDHFNQVQKYLGFRKASSNYLRNFHKWLVERALEHDKPTFLLQLSCEKLVERLCESVLHALKE
jgi:TnpA family transposase